MSRKLRAIHIHSDAKFLSNSVRFIDNRFENDIIFLGEKKYTSNISDDFSIFVFSDRDLKKIVERCNQADLVILFGLDHFKSRIVNNLNDTVQIAWRFFGYELYSRHLEKFLSSQTKMLHFPLGSLILHRISLIPYKIKMRMKMRGSWEKTLRRINYFFCLSVEEYQVLKSLSPNLPQFVKYPIFRGVVGYDAHCPKENIVILGNNRSIYNNHLELLSLVSNHQLANDVSFLLPFSYGTHNKYSKEVASKASKINNTILINDFMTKEEYTDLFCRAKAAVYNGYRQMALGNVFLCFTNRVKVYMNPKSLVYTWLLNEGFIIYTIKDFERDLVGGNFGMSEEIGDNNMRQAVAIYEKHDNTAFLNELYGLINANLH